MAKLQKFIPNIYTLLNAHIEKELAKNKDLNFDGVKILPTSNSFILTDCDGDRWQVSNDRFFDYLLNTNFKSSIDECEFFASRVGTDTEIQSKLEEFFYVEQATERFLNTIAPNSYERCFEILEPLKAPKKGSVAHSMTDVDKVYIMVEDSQEEAKLLNTI
jgi:predicted secreted protein